MPNATHTRRRSRIGAQRKRLLLALTIALILSTRSFLIQFFYVPSASMEPTLLGGDRVLTWRPGVNSNTLTRGQVVVFRTPSTWSLDTTQKDGGFLQWVGLRAAPLNAYYIKRIVGLPGEVVSCCSPSGKVEINGTELQEDYLANFHKATNTPFYAKVPNNSVWVMGDNRDHSSDSREHENPLTPESEGSVPVDAIVGKATAILWPLPRATRIDSDLP